jgi:hypothetical protein
MDETTAGHEIVNRHLQSCLGELLQAGLSHPDAAVHTGGVWTVLFAVFPSAPEADNTPPLIECDRNCLTLLARMQRPLSGCRICKEIERQGLGIWGVVTVKRSLAKLKRLDLVCNSRRRPRGYFLPEQGSLFLRTLDLDTKQWY